MSKRRPALSVFNLSFLDIMFCGFGAVVLLVLIIHSRINTENKQYTENLDKQISGIEQQLQAAQRYLLEITNELQHAKTESLQLISEIEMLDKRGKSINKNNQLTQQYNLTRKEQLENLKMQLKSMEKKSQTLEVEDSSFTSNKILKFQGEGQRQYLSGLKMGGKHILILLDASASMLDSTIVNVLRRRNMSESSQRKSKKWQRAVKTVHWLVANMPLDSKLQVLKFNTNVESLTPAGKLNWIDARDTKNINKMMSSLASVVPEKGTSIVIGFESLRKMKPLPDNVFLLTDGLPTQGKSPSAHKKITGKQRIELFDHAVKLIPKGIPVNTILYPMEGDPMAAVLYWKLAVDTRGSFMTPSKDWP